MQAQQQVKAVVKVMAACKFWIMSVQEGSLAHLPNGLIANSGKKLVDICNQYGIKIENKQAIAPELAKKLIY